MTFRKGRIQARQLVFASLLALGCECGPAKWADISNTPEFNMVIGKKIRLKTDVWQIEISMKTPPEPVVDEIVLVSGVGFGGRYVVRKTTLKKGTVLKIVRVIKEDDPITDLLTKMFKESHLEYSVEEVGTQFLNAAPAGIYSTDIVGIPSDGNLGLRPEVYELIP